MASIWELSVTLIDTKQNRTNLRYKMGEITGADIGAEALIASGRADDIITDLKAISDANVFATRLSALNENGVDAGLPADADITDELVILVHTNDVNYPDELATLRVPAPIAGVWVNNDPAQGLDLTDAGAQGYVSNFETAFEVSDGEHVTIAEGTAGMKSGYWRSVADKVKP